MKNIIASLVLGFGMSVHGTHTLPSPLQRVVGSTENLLRTKLTKTLVESSGIHCKVGAKLSPAASLPEIYVKAFDTEGFEIGAATFTPSYERNSKIVFFDGKTLTVTAYRSCEGPLCDDIPETITITETLIAIRDVHCILKR